MKTVYLFDAESGAYRGEYNAHPSPLEPGVFIVPVCSSDTPPPVAGEFQMAVFANEAWGLVDVPQPLPDDPPAPADPQSVVALQALLAIDQAGLAVAYEAWATDAARTFAQRAFIDKAQNWRRDDATLIAAATALGLSSEQVDNLFILAATL